jgi:hypothetical protein
MANSLPPDLPPGFWDEYRKRIESDIASLRRDLDPLESGEMHLRSIGTDGVMHDVTESSANNKELPVNLERAEKWRAAIATDSSIQAGCACRDFNRPPHAGRPFL